MRIAKRLYPDGYPNTSYCYANPDDRLKAIGADQENRAIVIDEVPETSGVHNLKKLLQDCLGFIEMKMSHTGAQTVEQIMNELERLKGISEVGTSHHLGCAQTTRYVNLDAIRTVLKD